MIHAQQPSLETTSAHAVPRAAISFPEAAILLVSDRARCAGQRNANSETRLRERSSFFPQNQARRATKKKLCKSMVKRRGVPPSFQTKEGNGEGQGEGLLHRAQSGRIDLVTVLDAILTSRQTREKLQCLYENLMSNNFRRTAVLKKCDL